jgi:hypothetical protein
MQACLLIPDKVLGFRSAMHYWAFDFYFEWNLNLIFLVHMAHVPSSLPKPLYSRVPLCHNVPKYFKLVKIGNVLFGKRGGWKVFLENMQ